jgi:exodeoxyribonuclease-5
MARVSAIPELSPEQGAVFDAVVDHLHRRQVQTVGGFAGTGKTVLVAALTDALPGFVVTAFTGKAAHVLRRKGVVGAATIHSTIYHPVELPPPLPPPDPPDPDDPDEAPPPPPPPSVAWVLRDPDKLLLENGDPIEGFLIDEASMVSEDLLDDLLSFDRPCVFVGDHGQLPPVGSDVHLMREPGYRLEQIHRNAGPVAKFAEHLRRGGAPGSSPALCEDVRVIRRGALTDAMLLDADQIICAYNKTRVALNRRVRSLLGRTQPLEVGDKIICLRNSKTAGLFNGQQGVVTRVAPGERMDFADDDGRQYAEVPFDPLQFGKLTYEHDKNARHPFDFAYAVTCHKAQGSEWSRVLVQEQYCPFWEMRRWTYTAASRAQERLTWAL